MVQLSAQPLGGSASRFFGSFSFLSLFWRRLLVLRNHEAQRNAGGNDPSCLNRAGGLPWPDAPCLFDQRRRPPGPPWGLGARIGTAAPHVPPCPPESVAGWLQARLRCPARGSPARPLVAGGLQGGCPAGTLVVPVSVRSRGRVLPVLGGLLGRAVWPGRLLVRAFSFRRLTRR